MADGGPDGNEPSRVCDSKVRAVTGMKAADTTEARRILYGPNFTVGTSPVQHQWPSTAIILLASARFFNCQQSSQLAAGCDRVRDYPPKRLKGDLSPHQLCS